MVILAGFDHIKCSELWKVATLYWLVYEGQKEIEKVGLMDTCFFAQNHLISSPD